MDLFTPLQYLKMDIASSFGLSKKGWQERLNWFDTNWPAMALLVDKAEEPAQFMAGKLAYEDTLVGKPTGYLCGLDATASGMQLLAVLSGCEASAALCNVIDTGRREDAYTNVSDQVSKILGKPNAVPAKSVKQAVMCHLYGSKAEPQKAFGEGTPELKAFYQAIDEKLPGANQLNYDLLELWNPEALSHNWTLPDGFEVVVKVMGPVQQHVSCFDRDHVMTTIQNQPMESGLSLGANIIHSIDGMIVREMGRRCNHSEEHLFFIESVLGGDYEGKSTKRKKDISLLRQLALFDRTNFMSMVILEYLDQDNVGHLESNHVTAIFDLICYIPERPFQMLAIHDNFKCHANYCNDMRKQYNHILAELAKSTALDMIVSELVGKEITINKLSTDLSSKIYSSNYAIC